MRLWTRRRQGRRKGKRERPERIAPSDGLRRAIVGAPIDGAGRRSGPGAFLWCILLGLVVAAAGIVIWSVAAPPPAHRLAGFAAETLGDQAARAGREVAPTSDAAEAVRLRSRASRRSESPGSSETAP